jgi:hypothetical protein
MKIIVLLITICILASCSTSSEKIMLPDGEIGIAIRCEEFIHDCYKEASKSCPNGYEIKDKATASNFLVPIYNLMITCKAQLKEN